MPAIDKSMIQPAERDGIWWCQTYENVRIAFAITDKALKYYYDHSIMVQFYYKGEIDLHADYVFSNTTYKRVYVAKLSLTYRYYCGNLCGVYFDQDRTVIFDETGSLIGVFGDKRPPVGIS